MDTNKELIEEIKKLRLQINKFQKYFNTTGMFFGGVLRGIGILVGATVLVLVGSMTLRVLGLLPGFSDIVEIIVDAFEKAKIN